MEGQRFGSCFGDKLALRAVTAHKTTDNRNSTEMYHNGSASKSGTSSATGNSEYLRIIYQLLKTKGKCRTSWQNDWNSLGSLNGSCRAVMQPQSPSSSPEDLVFIPGAVHGITLMATTNKCYLLPESKVTCIQALLEWKTVKTLTQTHWEGSEPCYTAGHLICSPSAWPICNTQTSSNIFWVSRKDIIATEMAKNIYCSVGNTAVIH